VELAKVREQKSAEERSQKEAERRQHEKEKQQMIFEKDNKKKTEEQCMIWVEEDKRKKEEDEHLKHMEKQQISQLLVDNDELKRESQNGQQMRESHINKAESQNNQQKLPKVKHNEENRLYEQLKVLQALKQQESEQNQDVSKSSCISGSETSKDKKCKKNVTFTNESEKQLVMHKLTELEAKKQTQLVKVQEQNKFEREKCGKPQVCNNIEKTESLQKQTERTQVRKTEVLCKKKDEKAKQIQVENDVNKQLLMQKNADTSAENLSQNKQLPIEKHNSPDQIRSAREKHKIKLRSSADDMDKSVKYEISQSLLRNEADGQTPLIVSSQVQKPAAVKCHTKNTSTEFSNAWEKTVETKRLKWMQECESWRYV